MQRDDHESEVVREVAMATSTLTIVALSRIFPVYQHFDLVAGGVSCCLLLQATVPSDLSSYSLFKSNATEEKARS